MALTTPPARIPVPLAFAIRPLPLWPLSLMLGALVRRLDGAHPEIRRRLGSYEDRRFLVDPSDLPFVMLLDLSIPRIDVYRRAVDAPRAQARIAGRLSAFLAMLHGAEDGDALFFSRDLEISGETAAVLALRNALDDAELDLAEEIAAMSGALGPLTRHLCLNMERLTGLALHRADRPFSGTTGDL
jgi:predicted lipid carrier protein YhbT